MCLSSLLLHISEVKYLFQWCETGHLQLRREEELLQCDGNYQRKCWARWDLYSKSKQIISFQCVNQSVSVLLFCVCLCTQTGMWSMGTTGTVGFMVPSTRAVGHQSCWNWPGCWAGWSSRVRRVMAHRLSDCIKQYSAVKKHSTPSWFFFCILHGADKFVSVPLCARQMEASQVHYIWKLGSRGVWAYWICRIHRGDFQLIHKCRHNTKQMSL